MHREQNREIEVQEFFNRLPLIFAWLLFIPFNLFSQVAIKNTSLLFPDSAILYSAVENKLEVTGAKEKVLLRLQSGKSEIRRNEINPFIFYVTAGSPDSETVEVYENSKLVLSKAFRVSVLADPEPKFGSIEGTAATVDQILTDPVIRVVLPGCYYNHLYRVIYFKTAIHATKGRVEVFDREGGNRLTKDQLKSIKQLKKGSRIILTEITATCPECPSRRLSDLVLVIE